MRQDEPLMTNIGLLIIDMQQGYFADDILRSQQAQLTQSINELIRQVRRTNGYIINVRTEHAKDASTWTLNMIRDEQGFLFHGSKEAEAVEGLELKDVIEVVKTRDSAFYNTTLKDSLQNFGVETMILCGVSTHLCITQTAADAYAANFQVILASDAIADQNPTYHDVSLRMLTEEYRQQILTTREIAALLADGSS